MVRFVVDDHDVFHAHQIRHHALNHLSFGFKRLRIIAGSPLEQLLATLGDLDAFTELEGVVVGDDDLGSRDVIQHVARHQLTVLVIAVRIVGLQHAQTILDGEARRTE
ncbi:hypothetical protein D3C78_1554920 [compost metagenome]